MKKVLIAAIVGGLIAFVWSAISHMALPLGEMGLSSLPHEEAVLDVLRSSVPDRGLYFFPGFEAGGEMTAEEQAAWEAKLQTGPVGLLAYRPTGGEAMSPRQLLTELLSNIVAAAVAAYLVSLMVGAYGRRVLAVALLGLFAWLSISASYWNWYGFPGSFSTAEGIDQIVSWFLAGLAIARIVPPARATAG